MNIPKIAEAMGYIDDELISAAAERAGGTRNNSRRRRRLAAALAAAIAALLLGACAAAVIYTDGIQGWFGRYWEEITGRPMSEGQAAAIDHLSQQINISQTCGDVTVTVDSAVVGDGSFFVLLRVSGVRLSPRYSYGFAQTEMTMMPDPLADGGIGGYGLNYLCADGDGSALLLLEHEYSAAAGDEPDTDSVQVDLLLTDFGRLRGGDCKILAEGQWSFSFAIDRSAECERVTLPDTVVSVYNSEAGEAVAAALTDIELTSMGLRFCCRESEMFSLMELELRLKNGAYVYSRGGTGAAAENEDIFTCSCWWDVPVDLGEVEAVIIGETEIRLP
ncbi:MAG: DUF4179 domain-containing protein [Oscillospiraceae bacterium]|nr:DUF4179 domain-containing protein [Oscillospiraceae bacterium]